MEFGENDLKRNEALVSPWCLFFPSLTQPAHSARATSLPPSLRLRSPRRSEERGKAKVAVVVAAAAAVATSAAEMGTLRAMEREREAGNEMEEGPSSLRLPPLVRLCSRSGADYSFRRGYFQRNGREEERHSRERENGMGMTVCRLRRSTLPKRCTRARPTPGSHKSQLWVLLSRRE